MEKVASLSKKIILSTKNIPDKKSYIEFFTAILSVPVLITVIMLNVNNLKGNSKSNVAVPPASPKEEKIFIPVTVAAQNTSKNSTPEASITPTPAISAIPSNQACKREIGPVSISTPSEGDSVTENPVSIIISYKTGEFCAVVWSYRLNDGAWSAYDDKSIALYNLPRGKIKIDVKVKSIVTGDEQILTRNFTYEGKNSSITPTELPAITDTKNSSSSAN